MWASKIWKRRGRKKSKQKPEFGKDRQNVKKWNKTNTEKKWRIIRKQRSSVRNRERFSLEWSVVWSSKHENNIWWPKKRWTKKGQKQQLFSLYKYLLDAASIILFWEHWWVGWSEWSSRIIKRRNGKKEKHSLSFVCLGRTAGKSRGGMFFSLKGKRVKRATSRTLSSFGKLSILKSRIEWDHLFYFSCENVRFLSSSFNYFAISSHQGDRDASELI